MCSFFLGFEIAVYLNFGAIMFKSKNEVNMLSGSIFKGLIAITVPIMIMNVLQSLVSVVDMSMLKLLGKPQAVGAVGACGTLISLITGLLIGISSGSSVVVARYIGKKDSESVEKAVGTAYALALAGGILIAVIGVVFGEVFLTWMNCPEELIDKAVLYFRIYFCGIPFIMFYNFSASILRAMGDSKHPMLFLSLGNILKVGLNVFFVLVFDTDVVGVAIATIIAQLIAGALSFMIILKNKGMVKFKVKHLRFYGKHVKEILFIGIPAGLQQALYSLANVIITSAVNAEGEFATTGIAIANQFDGILYQISVAPSLAAMSYVSQNVGMGNLKRARKAVGTSMLITIIFAASIGALSAIFSKQLSSLMSDVPEVIAYARQKMIIISSTYFICGINEIMSASLRGMNNPIVPTISTFIFMCALRFVWVFAIYYPFFKGNLTFLYLVWPVGWILSICLLTVAFIFTCKKLKNKIQAEKMVENEN